MAKQFLSAEWNDLLMANYIIDPQLLASYVPPKTTLDLYKGKCYVSLIGFKFEETALLGLKIPFHINFEEVNLRFYVTFKENGILKRGAVFIKEIVPKRAVTFIANTIYRENYITLPMDHYYEESNDEISLYYKWKFEGVWNKIEAVAERESAPMLPGSEEEFIAEHYWGYSKYDEQTGYEYGVEHEPWMIHRVKQYSIACNFEKLYGKDFAVLDQLQPESFFMAKGSPIKIMGRRKI